MKIHILGSAAGGGYPQWNCNCTMCNGVRSGSINAKSRTQSSIAINANEGADDNKWVLFNTSPDILTQLKQTPSLQPANGVRDTAIESIFLLDSQIDHTTGLLMLREHSAALEIWCTEQVHQDLSTGNPLFRVLSHYCDINWHQVTPGETCAEVPGAKNIELQPLPLISNAPPYSPRRDQPVPGDTLGMLMTDQSSGKSIFYAPGLGQIEPHIWKAMQSADVVLVDGTMWTDDEMQKEGVGKKTARSMGHLPQTGDGGMLEWLTQLPDSTRKVLIHINNTNPILNEDGPEYAQLRNSGIEVAFDGMLLEV